MKYFLKYFFFMFVLVVSSAALSSCSSDDDDELTTGNIVGTWVSVETETLSSGISITTTYTLSFSSNGSGYRSSSEKYSTGAESSDMYTFRYTIAIASDGKMTVTMIDDDDNYTQSFTCTQTGNSLLVGTRLYTRK